MTKNQDEEAMELQAAVSLKRLQGKRLMVVLVVAAIILCIILAYIVSKFFHTNTDTSTAGASVATISTNDPNAKQVDSFYDMDELIINLVPTANQRHFLKMIVSFRLAHQQDVAVVTSNLAAIQDSFLIFLKELRAQDFSGSGATMKLKEELMKRVNKVIYPVEVKDVLFKEILVD